MALTNRELTILGILLCCVPLQLWLSKLSSLTPEEKGLRIQDIFIDNKIYIEAFLSPSLWVLWLKEAYKNIFVKDYSLWYPDDGSPNGECPAVEVIKYKFPEGHFATSAVPRESRFHVKWRVGQVVLHKKFHYIGVIIGWDRTCKAPDFWIKQMHGNNHHYRLQPNYAILVDVRHQPEQQITYVVEDNLEIVKAEVDHPDLERYFDAYDGKQYLPQSWLKALYPLD